MQFFFLINGIIVHSKKNCCSLDSNPGSKTILRRTLKLINYIERNNIDRYVLCTYEKKIKNGIEKILKKNNIVITCSCVCDR